MTSTFKRTSAVLVSLVLTFLFSMPTFATPYTSLISTERVRAIRSEASTRDASEAKEKIRSLAKSTGLLIAELQRRKNTPDARKVRYELAEEMTRAFYILEPYNHASRGPRERLVLSALFRWGPLAAGTMALAGLKIVYGDIPFFTPLLDLSQYRPLVELGLGTEVLVALGAVHGTVAQLNRSYHDFTSFKQSHLTIVGAQKLRIQFMKDVLKEFLEAGGELDAAALAQSDPTSVLEDEIDRLIRSDSNSQLQGKYDNVVMTEEEAQKTLSQLASAIQNLSRQWNQLKEQPADPYRDANIKDSIRESLRSALRDAESVVSRADITPTPGFLDHSMRTLGLRPSVRKRLRIFFVNELNLGQEIPTDLSSCESALLGSF